MSKKDYIAIANAIKDTKKYLMTTGQEGEMKGVNKLTEALITVFKVDNYNFDTERFYTYIESDKRYKDFTDK